MLIMHISDTHLGKRQYSLIEREKDVYQTFSQLIDIAIKEHVNAIIHSGDLFDVFNPSNNAIVEAIRNLKKLKESNIPFISIPGDHDTPKRKGSVYPHYILTELDLIKVLDHKTTYVLQENSIEIYGIPHVPTVSKIALKEILSSLKPKTNKSILLLHQGIRQLLPYESAWQIEINDLPKGFKYYALGHIHTRWKIRREDGSIVAVAGSPDIMREEEIDGYNKFGKGAYLIDFSKDEPLIQDINLEVRPQRVVTINTKNLKAEIEKIKNEVKREKLKPLLHIILQGDPIRKDFLNRALSDLTDFVLYYRIYKDETKQLLNNEEISIPQDKSLDKIILDYLIKHEGFSNVEANLILELIKNVDNEIVSNEIIKKLVGLE